VTIVASTFSRNDGTGMSASGGTVVIERSTIVDNRAGGIDLAGTKVELRNSFLVRNGNAASPLGAFRLNGTPTGSIVEFNTIAENQAMDTAAAIQCFSVAIDTTIANNLVFHNTSSTPRPQVAGNGATVKNNFSDEEILGTDNIRTTQASTAIFRAPGADFHLRPGAEAIGKASDSTLAIDIDGDVRPQPAGSKRDIGADEVPE